MIKVTSKIKGVKMKLKTICAVLVCVFAVLIFCGCTSGVKHDISEYVLTYDMGDKESFSILQLSDIHLANKDQRARQYEFLTDTINFANADMIVITGDLFTFADKTVAKELFAFLDGFGIPWTITFGNHDEQCYFSIDWLTGYLNEFGSNCLFKDIQDDDVYGNANFAINVTKNGKIFEQVIIMDSNRYNYGEYTGYDYLKQDQIDWYKSLVDYTTSQNGGEVAKSLLYFHIPVPEYEDALTACDYSYQTNRGDESKGYVMGWMGEGVSCPKYNSGFFDAVLEKGSSQAISVGHDHKNNLVVQYKGVYLCYGVNSTDRIYFDENLIGGRVLTVNADHSLSFRDVVHNYDN